MSFTGSKLRYCLWGGGMSWIQIGGDFDRRLTALKISTARTQQRIRATLMPHLERLASLVREVGA